MNVLTTNDIRPPSTARPPTSTRAVDGPRGTLCAISQCTAGDSSAVSRIAIATGMTTTRSSVTR